MYSVMNLSDIAIERLQEKPHLAGMIHPLIPMTLREPNTGMAVTLDIGEADNIHPTNKQVVGGRLDLAARHLAYGEGLVYSGPVFRSMTVKGSTVRLESEHVGGELLLDDRYGYARGFALAGKDRIW